MTISRFTVSVSLRATTSSSVLSSLPCPSFPFFAPFFSEFDLVLRHLPAVHSVGAAFFSSDYVSTSLPAPLHCVPDSRARFRPLSGASGPERPRNVPLRRQLLPLFVDECRGRRCAVSPVPSTPGGSRRGSITVRSRRGRARGSRCFRYMEADGRCDRGVVHRDERGGERRRVLHGE